MNVVQLAKQVERFTTDNSPLILTSIGVAGVIGTAVLTGKATLKAQRILDFDREVMLLPDSSTFTNQYVFKKVWKEYIPAASAGAMTITCVVLANRIGTRRAAAMAAAYTIAEKGFEEYREKIIEKLGPNKEREARDEIAQDRVNAQPISTAQIIVTDNGDVPFLDVYTGRYFKSDMESVKFAINKINNQINHHMYASLNDFYNQLELPHIPLGEEVGWRDHLLEVSFTTSVTDDNKPCFVMTFQVEPVRNYFRTH